MTVILIRVDASLFIGSGHVMRCRTFARELQRRGAQVTFLCRRQRGHLIDLLAQEFSVLALPELPLAAKQSHDAEPLQGRELYAAWLGCSQEQDCNDCLQALQQAGIDAASWVVVDHYGLDASWQHQLLVGLAVDRVPHLLVIDDLADRSHQADLLLDQNFFGAQTDTRYAGLVPAVCRQLLGPHYALLGPEYVKLHPLVPPRTELRRVLVFFGGVDPGNLTGRALKALMAPELAHLAVDVVLGLQSPHRQVVVELVARRPQTTMHDPLPSLAGLIARADLAIGAGGATTWERACLGLPSLVVAIAENQLPFARALDQLGQIKLLSSIGTVTPEQIRRSFLEALQYPWPVTSGHGLTDGWGAARLATALLGPQQPIQLRPAEARDEELLLRWANDPQVRANSFSPELIAPADHQRWFRAGLADANRLLLIACDAAGCPLGQIRFDHQSDCAEGKPGEAMIGISLDRCARGCGLATELVRLGLHAMEQHWGPGTEAVAEVLAGNAASQATFSRAGFLLESDQNNPPTSSRMATRWRWRP
jgi:UDP-2,4-diacetamido-2,4,6-trideoxy-beta-L-altropyranose hydrolase